MQETWALSWVGKTHWRRKWQPTPIYLPGKSHGETSLVGCSPGGHKRVAHDLMTKHIISDHPKELYKLGIFLPHFTEKKVKLKKVKKYAQVRNMVGSEAEFF